MGADRKAMSPIRAFWIGLRVGITLCFCRHRDADETKEWIEEKNQALNTDNYGHDLASVQALQRKHEGFERDLAALGDKVRLCQTFMRLSLIYNQMFFGVFVFFKLLTNFFYSSCSGELPWGDG